VQCLRTYDMETANNITINTDDKNLAEVIKKIIADAELTVADLFDDDEVRDHIHEAEIPIEDIYDEDDILECDCVKDAIAQEREDCEQETVESYEEEIEEYQSQVAQLEETIAELKSGGTKPVLEYNRQLGEQNAELKEKIAELETKRAEFEREKAREIMGNLLALCTDKLDRLERENAELKKKMEEWSAKMDATHGDLTKSAEDAVAEHKKKNDKLKVLYRAKCAEVEAIIHENLGRFGKCCDGHGVGGWFEIVDPPTKEGMNLRHIIPKE